jgi:hypothetical protein
VAALFLCNSAALANWRGEQPGIMKISVFRMNQATFVVIWMLCSGQTAFAQLELLQRCTAIAADQERLACFDALSESLLTLPQETSEAPVAADRTEAVAVMPDGRENDSPKSNADAPTPGRRNSSTTFGLEQQVIAESGPDTITASVVSVSRSRLGTWTVEFDNGQVWQQVGTDNFSIRAGETYRIERASRNSFLMKREGYNRGIRVSRVQ